MCFSYGKVGYNWKKYQSFNKKLAGSLKPSVTHITGFPGLEGENLRRDAGSSQDFGFHGVQTFTLADTQFDLHSVMGIVLEEEAVVDDELRIGPRAVEDINLQEEKIQLQRHPSAIFIPT